MLHPELSKWLDEDRSNRLVRLSKLLEIELERHISNSRRYFNESKQLIVDDLQFRTNDEVAAIVDTLQMCEQYFQDLEDTIHKILRKKYTKYFTDYSDDEWERYFIR